MKKTVILILLTIYCMSGLAFASEDDVEAQVTQTQLNNINLNSIEQELRKMQEAYPIPQLNVDTMMKMMRGEEKFSMRDILQTGLNFLINELRLNLSLLIKILLLALLAVLALKLQSAFNGSIADIVYGLVYLVIVILAAQSFSIALRIAHGAIQDLMGFMLALLPILMTMLMSLGHVVTASMFDPLLMVGCQMVSNIVSYTVLPIFFASGILTLVDHLNTEINISRMASLVRSCGAFILGCCFTVFAGLTIMRGTAGSVADGIALRTGKYLTKGFLPVIGNMVADAFDTVLGCSLIIKNGLGLFGLILVFLLCAFPAIKLIAMILMFRVAAACVQPLDQQRIAPALSSMATVLTYMMAAVLTVGIMLFISIATIMIAGNISVMFR